MSRKPKTNPSPTPRDVPPAQAARRDERIAALAHAVTAQIMAELREYLPVVARLAAADTIHTTQEPETVMRHAIGEGRLAAKIINEKEN